MKTHRHVIHFLCLLGLWLGMGLQAHAQTDTVYVYYTDPQGTPLVKTDAQGNVIARYDYTPYGNAVTSLGSPPNGPGYTGHVNDPETGLVYMQQRYYQPDGRFLSPDPAGMLPGDVYSFNRYVYVSNNPIVNVDPTGMQDCSAIQSDKNHASCPPPKNPSTPPPSPNGVKSQPPVIVTATPAHDTANSQQVGVAPPIFKIEEGRILFRKSLTKTIKRKADEYISKQVVKKVSFKTLTISKDGFLEPTPFAFGFYILTHSPDLGGCDSHGQCADEAPIPPLNSRSKSK